MTNSRNVQCRRKAVVLHCRGREFEKGGCVPSVTGAGGWSAYQGRLASVCSNHMVPKKGSWETRVGMVCAMESTTKFCSQEVERTAVAGTKASSSCQDFPIPEHNPGPTPGIKVYPSASHLPLSHRVPAPWVLIQSSVCVRHNCITAATAPCNRQTAAPLPPPLSLPLAWLKTASLKNVRCLSSSSSSSSLFSSPAPTVTHIREICPQPPLFPSLPL
ncbi:hypothetical protein GALMADRAFT_1171186 [Galerina marginata CBS 339.88]|uniref:Uncharacterized protein n=1 Tax=Galerina marginata (strain CBS 339.88) TaxID=685588 RepID=A0A067TM04_GALM3|nr:hypothetical protein GALMADRAFT_1171186 [Galerina marginata CBS 339.88]